MTTQPDPDPSCPDCGHTHAGPALAGICVGCPCPTRPEPTAVTTQPEPTASTLDLLVDDLAEALASPEYDLGLTAEQAEAAATFGVHWLDGANHLTVDPIATRSASGHITVEWPDGGRTARITREVLDEITAQLNDLNRLRLLLGLQPGQTLCGATSGGHESMTCLLPAEHTTVVGEGWHRSLGGSWTA